MTERLSISPDVLFRELEGEAVLLDLKSQRYFGLDAVGTRIWQLLEELRRPEAVLTAMLEEFDVSREQLEGDLEAFLARLREAGLILTGEAAPEGDAPRKERENDPQLR